MIVAAPSRSTDALKPARTADDTCKVPAPPAPKAMALPWVAGATSIVPDSAVTAPVLDSASVSRVMDLPLVGALSEPFVAIAIVPPGPVSRLTDPPLEATVPATLISGLAEAAGGVPGPAPPTARMMLPLAPTLTPVSMLMFFPASMVSAPAARLNELCTSRVCSACSDTLPTKLFSTEVDRLSVLPVSCAVVTEPLNVPSRLPPLATISRLSGSNRMVPRLPSGAATLIEPVVMLRLPPETSTLPPFPPFLPPFAVISPFIVVLAVDSTATVPPSPAVVASAAMVAP